MKKTYEESMILRTRDCDMTGTWRMSALLTEMQELSGTHSELLGCGRDALLSGHGQVWVLTRVEARLQRPLCLYERLRLQTMPMPNRRVFFPRYFTIDDERGERVGCAGSVWALMDIATRTLSRDIAPVAARIPDNSDLTAPMPWPGAPEDVAGAGRTLTRAIVYSDLDVNEHVNNTRYADFLCDALGEDTMRERWISRLCVEYVHEVRPGQTLELRLAQNENRVSLSGWHGGTRHVQMSAELAPR